MNIEDVLEADWEAVGALRDPILVIALRGYFDIAGAATGALDWWLEDRLTTVVASVDSDPFFDFTAQRPEVFLDEDNERQIIWPENDFIVARFPDGARDLVVLSGVEPHMNWNIFAECIVQCAQRLKCSVVVTVGANDDSIPHTRTPNVIGSTSNVALARRLKLDLPKYQGPTGLIGVLHERFEREHLPSVSLRVGVPRYLLNAQHPKSSAALLRKLELVLGVPTRHAELYEEIHRWSELHDAAVEGDEQIANFVKILESDFDRLSQIEIPTADDLGAQLEQFLREQPDENPEK